MSDHRLSRDVLPRHYALELRPDLDEHTFTGTVAIDVEVATATDRITCNAAELVVLDAAVIVDGERTALSASLDEAAERLVLLAPSPLAPGRARLELAFSGLLNNRLRGFYRSTLVGADGVEQTVATTQFQSTDARRAFPCFDEPDMKA